MRNTGYPRHIERDYGSPLWSLPKPSQGWCWPYSIFALWVTSVPNAQIRCHSIKVNGKVGLPTMQCAEICSIMYEFLRKKPSSRTSMVRFSNKDWILETVEDSSLTPKLFIHGHENCGLTLPYSCFLRYLVFSDPPHQQDWLTHWTNPFLNLFFTP